MRARKVNRDHAIAAEVERPVIWAEMRFVIGAESVRFLLIAKVPNLYLSPSLSRPAHDEIALPPNLSARSRCRHGSYI